LKLLPDIKGYEEIIRALAAEEYFKKYPNKERLPKKFQEYFSLSISELKHGSVCPVLVRDEHELLLIPPDPDEFDHARDLLNEYIQSINDGAPIERFPKKIIPLFENFGRNLKDDESIELGVPDSSIRPTYSKSSRLAILSISRKPYSKGCSLTGWVCGFDAEKGNLLLILEDSTPIRGPLNPVFDDMLREQARKYNKKETSSKDTILTVFGLGKYNPDDSIYELEKLDHVIVYNDGIPEYYPSMDRKFEALMSSEEMNFFKLEDIEWVRDWLSSLLKKQRVPAPYIYFLSETNQIEAEWSFGFQQASVTFDLSNRAIFIHNTDVNTSETTELEIEPNDSCSVEHAEKFLAKILSN